MRRLLAILFVLLLAPLAAAGVQYINTDGANQSIGNGNLLFLDNTNGMIGIGTVNPTQALHVSGSATVTGNSIVGGKAAFNGAGISNNIGIAVNTPSSASSTNYGVQAINGLTSGTLGYDDEDFCDDLCIKAGVLGRSSDGYGVLAISTGGTGLYTSGDFTAIEATGSNYGIRATGGTGLYITPANVGVSIAATTGLGLPKYGIYQAGASDTNYFAGNLSIGAIAPTQALHVSGSANITGTLYVDNVNTGSGAMELGDAAVANSDTDSIPTSDQVYDFVIAQNYITDGNTNWDNSYGFITSPDDTVSGTELDGVFNTTGLLLRTGAGTYSTITDSSANWDTAYGWGNHASAGYIVGTSMDSLAEWDAQIGLTGTPGSGNFLRGDGAWTAGFLDADGVDAVNDADSSTTNEIQTLGTSGNTITLTGSVAVTAPYAANAGTLDSIDSTSFLRSDTTDSAAGKITFATGLARSGHAVGHLEGSYNSVGANDAKSNPIYTIGSSYNPLDASLSNMYGIGYSHSNFWNGLLGVGQSDGWGLYVASDGDIRATISGENGNIWSTGTATVATVNTGQGATEVHLMNQNVRTSDSPSFTGLTLSGTTFTTAGSSATYGSLTIDGSNGGYSGIHFADVSGSGDTLMVHNTAGIQGFYDLSGSWDWYFDDGVLTVGSVPWARVTGFTGDTTADTIADDSSISIAEAAFTDQNVLTSSAVTFATVNTGQGANELYDMNQNVLTTSSPAFAGLTVNGQLDYQYMPILRFTNTLVLSSASSATKDSQCSSEFGSGYVAATVPDLYMYYSGTRSGSDWFTTVATSVSNPIVLSDTIRPPALSVTSSAQSRQVACIVSNAPFRFTRSTYLTSNSDATKDSSCSSEFGSMYEAANLLDITASLNTADAGSAHKFGVAGSSSSYHVSHSSPDTTATSSVTGTWPLACIHK